MKKFGVILRVLLVLSLLFIWGCTKPYVITTDLEASIGRTETCTIGAITDELPIDTEESKKPTLETIGMLKGYLIAELSKRNLMKLGVLGESSARYEVTGSILSYKKGSGFMRFLFGFGVGAAKVVTNLKLTDQQSGTVIFAGNFTGQVSDWTESGNKMLERVAKDFAKQLDNRLKKIEKTQGVAEK